MRKKKVVWRSKSFQFVGRDDDSKIVGGSKIFFLGK
jgi:hypothetical protein